MSQIYKLDTKLVNIIEETKTTIFEIERTIFTKRYNLSEKHFEILSIQSISMLYALWERFIQKSFNYYIDYLNTCDLTLFSFCDDIVIHQMENTFKQLIEYPHKSKRKIRYFTNLKDFFNQEKQEIPRVINTESNVGFQVLNHLLKTFGLTSFPEYWHTYKHPNPNLKASLTSFLRIRNSVAHGGDLSSEDKVTHQVYIRFKKLVHDLMYAVREKMLQGVETLTYQKALV